MKDRHLLLFLTFIAFLGAMFIVTDLSANSEVVANRNARNIPQDLSKDLGLEDHSLAVPTSEDQTSSFSMTIEQSEMERLDTLLREMSEIQTLVDDDEETKILLGASYIR